MAENLQAGRKNLMLKCCPFCGSKMRVLMDFSSDCFINGKFVPARYCYAIGCSDPDCLISLDSHDNFYISESDIDSFLEKFNSRYSSDELFYVTVEDFTDPSGFLGALPLK